MESRLKRDGILKKNKRDNANTAQDNSEDEADSLVSDGGFGWVVVLGCFLIEGFVFGTIRCFSVFLVHFQQEFQATSNLVSWIPSICLAVLHASGVAAGHLCKKFGARLVVVVGGLLTSSGFFIASFAESITYVYLGIGLTTGLGFGLAYIPSNVIVGKYFNSKKRTVAYCITSTGGPVASFMLAPLFQFLVDNYSLKTSLFVVSIILTVVPLCGLVMTSPKATSQATNQAVTTERESSLNGSCDNHCLVFGRINEACCLSTIYGSRSDLSLNLIGAEQQNNVPVKKSSAKTIPETIPFERKTRSKSFGGFDSEKKTVQSRRFKAKMNVPKTVYEWNLNNTIDTKKKIVFSEPAEENSKSATYALHGSSVQLESGGSSNDEVTNDVEDLQEEGLQWGLLKQCSFATYCLVGLCIGAGAFTPNVFLVPHAISRGFVSYDSALLVSVMSGVSVFSSLACGYITTMSAATHLYCDVASLFLLGVSCLFCPLATTYAELATFCVFFGIFLGAVMALPFSVLAEIVGKDCLYSGFAFFMMATSVAVLVTPPVAGWLVDVTGQYDAIFYLSGGALILGSIGVLVIAVGTEVVDVHPSDRVVEVSNSPRSLATSTFGTTLTIDERTNEEWTRRRNASRHGAPKAQRPLRVRRQSILTRSHQLQEQDFTHRIRRKSVF